MLLLLLEHATHRVGHVRSSPTASLSCELKQAAQVVAHLKTTLSPKHTAASPNRGTDSWCVSVPPVMGKDAQRCDCHKGLLNTKEQVQDGMVPQNSLGTAATAKGPIGTL